MCFSFIYSHYLQTLYNITDTTIIITISVCHNYTQPQLFCSHGTCINSMLSELLLHELIALFSPFSPMNVPEIDCSHFRLLEKSFAAVFIYIFSCMPFLYAYCCWLWCSMYLLVDICLALVTSCNNHAAFICVGGLVQLLLQLLFIFLNVNFNRSFRVKICM